MSKRVREDDDEELFKHWCKLDRVLEDIVSCETSNIKNTYSRIIETLTAELNTCYRLIKSLEYKANWYQNSFDTIQQKYNHDTEYLLKKIYASYCVSCDDCDVQSIICENGHANCSTCLSIGIKSYISTQELVTKIPKCLKCNIPLEEEELCIFIDPVLWANFVSERTRMDTLKTIETCSTSKPKERFFVKSPCCHKPLIDFEGCCALSCAYCENTHYCAFCFKILTTTEECHKHVKSCVHNPEDSYHIISDIQIDAIRQCWYNKLLEQLSATFEFDLPNPVVPEDL